MRLTKADEKGAHSDCGEDDADRGESCHDRDEKPVEPKERMGSAL